VAVKQHEEGVRLLTLLEHGRVPGEPQRASLAQDGIEIGAGKSGKQR